MWLEANVSSNSFICLQLPGQKQTEKPVKPLPFETNRDNEPLLNGGKGRRKGPESSSNCLVGAFLFGGTAQGSREKQNKCESTKGSPSNRQLLQILVNLLIRTHSYRLTEPKQTKHQKSLLFWGPLFEIVTTARSRVPSVAL